MAPEDRYGFVTTPDGSVWMRCVSPERIAEAGLNQGISLPLAVEAIGAMFSGEVH